VKTRISIALFLLILLLGIGLIWWGQGTTPVNSADQKPKIFIINKGDSVRAIASKLKKEGLIKDQIIFFLLIKRLGIDQNLQAGEFRLNPSMNAQTIAKTLTKGMIDTWVTILEGWRDEEIAMKLAQELSLPESEFFKYSQEGYMFPDTYLIPKDATAGAIVKIMTDNFNKKFNQDLKNDAKKTGLTDSQVVILASIVEKEASGDSDRNIIAGILLKRLERGWPLQVDATVQYILGYQPGEKSWWKKELTDEDKKIISPYNTYLNLGLPPGPICNPGLASIKAVIYPQESAYWFYLHDPQGGVHFAKTQAEHEANIAKYLP